MRRLLALLLVLTAASAELMTVSGSNTVDPTAPASFKFVVPAAGTVTDAKLYLWQEEGAGGQGITLIAGQVGVGTDSPVSTRLVDVRATEGYPVFIDKDGRLSVNASYIYPGASLQVNGGNLIVRGNDLKNDGGSDLNGIAVVNGTNNVFWISSSNQRMNIGAVGGGPSKEGPININSQGKVSFNTTTVMTESLVQANGNIIIQTNDYYKLKYANDNPTEPDLYIPTEQMNGIAFQNYTASRYWISASNSGMHIGGTGGVAPSQGLLNLGGGTVIINSPSIGSGYGSIKIKTYSPSHTIGHEIDVSDSWSGLVFTASNDASSKGFSFMNGKVIIDTTKDAPLQLLQHEANTANGGVWNYIEFANSTHRQWWAGTNNGGSFAVGVSASHGIPDATTSATRFTITKEGNLGIGTTTPQAKLDLGGGPLIVQGNAEDHVYWFKLRPFSPQSGAVSYSIDVKNTATTYPDVMTFSYDGKVGIGGSTPEVPLHINSTLSSILRLQKLHPDSPAGTWNYIEFFNNTQRQWYVGTTNLGHFVIGESTHHGTPSNNNLFDLNHLDNTLKIGGAVVTTSSLRYKTDVTPLEFDSSKIYQLNPKSFTLKDTGKRSFGFIAEEVDPVLPQLVSYDSEGRPDALDYSRLSVLLVEELKKLKAENDALKSRLDSVCSQNGLKGCS